MHLEIQFIDTSTCNPAPNLLIDIWAANATGIYSGIDSSQAGADEGGLDSTFLRGLQMTDSSGVVSFDTNFPGHYIMRATHQHVTAYVNATLLPNGSYTGGTAALIGQLFFDETLRAAVEKTHPYTLNRQPLVSNDEDMWAPVAASAEFDPFVKYVMLGDRIENGLLAWITAGVDLSADYNDQAFVASFWTDAGGVCNVKDGFYETIPGGAVNHSCSSMKDGSGKSNTTVISNGGRVEPGTVWITSWMLLAVCLAV